MTSGGSRSRSLGRFDFPPGIQPLGSLAMEAEGLLFLTDEKGLEERRLKPEVYWVEVEGIPSESALHRIQKGTALKDVRLPPCQAWVMAVEPEVAPRPKAKSVSPTLKGWVGITLTKGDGRQLRQVMAAVGYPALRLWRVQLGNFALGDLAVGQWRELTPREKAHVFGHPLANVSPWRYHRINRLSA